MCAILQRQRYSHDLIRKRRLANIPSIIDRRSYRSIGLLFRLLGHGLEDRGAAVVGGHRGHFVQGELRK